MTYFLPSDDFSLSTTEETSNDECGQVDKPEADEALNWVISDNGKEKPFYCLYPFHLDYTKNGKNYWKCDKCKLGCKARLHTDAATYNFIRFIGHNRSQAHNHKNDPQALPLAQMLTNSRIRAQVQRERSGIDVNKPLREKQRRERINNRLDELTKLLFQNDAQHNPKLEKADILEMAVSHMTQLKEENVRLSQQVQDLSQNKEGETYYEGVHEGFTAVIAASSDVLLRLPMPAPLDTPECRQMLHKEVVDRLHIRMDQLKPAKTDPVSNSDSSSPVSNNALSSEQQFLRFFSSTNPSSSNPQCFPETEIPMNFAQMPPVPLLDTQYGHLSMTGQLPTMGGYYWPAPPPNSIQNQMPVTIPVNDTFSFPGIGNTVTPTSAFNQDYLQSLWEARNLRPATSSNSLSHQNIINNSHVTCEMPNYEALIGIAGSSPPSFSPLMSGQRPKGPATIRKVAKKKQSIVKPNRARAIKPRRQ